MQRFDRNRFPYKLSHLRAEDCISAHHNNSHSQAIQWHATIALTVRISTAQKKNICERRVLCINSLSHKSVELLIWFFNFAFFFLPFRISGDEKWFTTFTSFSFIPNSHLSFSLFSQSVCPPINSFERKQKLTTVPHSKQIAFLRNYLRIFKQNPQNGWRKNYNDRFLLWCNAVVIRYLPN